MFGIEKIKEDIKVLAIAIDQINRALNKNGFYGRCDSNHYKDSLFENLYSQETNIVNNLIGRIHELEHPKEKEKVEVRNFKVNHNGIDNTIYATDWSIKNNLYLFFEKDGRVIAVYPSANTIVVDMTGNKSDK